MYENVKTPRELSDAISSALQQETALREQEARKGNVTIRVATLHLNASLPGTQDAQQAAIKLRAEDPSRPLVPDSNRRVDYQNWCIDAERGDAERASREQHNRPKWTQPLSAPKWAELFGKINPKTMRQWLKTQRIKNKQVSPRKWRIVFSDLPADVYEKYAKSAGSITSV